MKKNCVVVDTSIAIKWAIKEDDSNIALALLNDWTDRGIIVLAPTLLAYEATNVLHRQVRKGTLSLADARKALTEIILDLIDFDISYDSSLHTRAMQIAHQFGLPATYDAHYLALAESQECELWTADLRLWDAIKEKLDWVRWMANHSPS